MLSCLEKGLAWIGRYGTAALAVSLLIGIALPFLASLVRPFLPWLVGALLAIAFFRVDYGTIVPRIKRPVLLLVALMWMMAGFPLLIALLIQIFGRDALGPELILALFISTAAPPVTAAQASLYLLGLDGAFSLVLSVAALAVTPLLVPIIGEIMVGEALPLSVGGLAAQLAILLAGSFAVGTFLRWLAGADRISRHKDAVSGMNVIILLIFAIAAMDGVALSFVNQPGLVLAIIASVFVIAFAQIGLTLLLFAPQRKEDAYVIAHTCSTRNMGLMVAAFGAAIPEFTWLWFALGQFPIYMLPMIVKPLALRYKTPSAPPP